MSRSTFCSKASLGFFRAFPFLLLMLLATDISSAAQDPVADADSSQAASAAGSAAPLNPQFVKHLSVRAQGHFAIPVTAEGHPLGLVPPPIDLSHLRTQPGPALHSATTIPSSYDLRGLGRVSPVKNQQQCGDCWAFATFGSMESILLPNETWAFSENNLNNLNGFDYGICQGGNYIMSTAYLARWAGPVNYSDDPDPAYDSPSPSGLLSQKHVQDVVVIAGRTSATDNNNLKSAVMTYGGVATSMYWADNAYNSSTAAYYWAQSGTTTTHVVTLVGWDDNYSSANFNYPNPPGNGAFLIKNSWGTGWGQSGYFWISYYDGVYAYDESAAFSGNQAVTNYSRQYEYDPLGWVTGYGYSGSTMGWFANVFTAADNAPLQAVAFYVASNSSPYVIKVYTGVSSSPTTGTLAATTSGTFPTAGYHTVVLPNSAPLTTGQKFSVVVQLTTPGYSYPIPLQYAERGYSSQATSSPGQSYVSSNGSSWTDATTTSLGATTSVALKAFAVVSSATYTLTVNSANPASGVNITVNPADNSGNSSGNTSFTRTYGSGTQVTLTAPATAASGNTFSSWSNCDQANGATCTVTMNAVKTVTANYASVTYILTVNSTNPASGVAITLSPADNNGSSSGNTSFTRTYNQGTQVTLTAPATVASGNAFASWSNCDQANGATCTLTMSAARTVTANYVIVPYTLTVNSTNPASGAAVTVSPADKNGASNGTTPFTRTYNSGTAVTLTAPSTAGGDIFYYWAGCDQANSTVCTLSMNAARTATATYIVPAPRVVTSPATGVGLTSAAVNGIVNPNGLATTYWFEYGTMDTLAKFSQTPHQNLPAGTKEVAVSAVLTGLTPHTTYYFRVAAQNSFGTSRGRILEFRLGGAGERGTVVTLTVSTTGTGSGTVTPNPLGNICGPGCYTYPLGTSVTLTETPNTGSVFAVWAGACSGNGTGNMPPCSVKMTANQSVVATFNLTSATTYSLTTAAIGNGSGTVTPNPVGTSCGTGCYTYASGTTVTLTATPATGSAFATWTGACTGTGSCSVTKMTSSQSVTATFTLKTFNLTTSTTGTGTGSVAPNPVGTSCGTGCYTYPWGTVVSLEAMPTTGSTFTGWGGACSGTASCRVTMTANQAVSAAFAVQTFNLTISTAGAGTGTVTPAPSGTSCGTGCYTYNWGTVVTLTATPTNGSVFGGWSGACTGTGSCSVTMKSSQTVTATFNRSFNLTISTNGTAAPGFGTVTPSPAGASCGTGCYTYASGTIVLLTAAPGMNTAFSGWGGACSGTASTCTVIMSSNQSVTATFNSMLGLTITINGTGSGTVAQNPTGVSYGTGSYYFAPGTVVTLTATPAAGSLFWGWGGVCSGNGSCTVTMNSNQSVTATFNGSGPGGGSLTGTWSGPSTETAGLCTWKGTMTWNLTQTGSVLTCVLSGTANLTSGTISNCGSNVTGNDNLAGSANNNSINLTGTQTESFTATVNNNTITGTGVATSTIPNAQFTYTLTKQ